MKHIYNYLIVVATIIILNGKAYSQASPYGVNLSGMEWGQGNLPGTAGTNYFVPSSAEFTYYKGKGIKLFRIPFLWERMQSSLGGALNTTYLSQLDGVVSSAASAGVSIILDCHNYARYPYNGNVITSSSGPTQAQFNDLWTKLATHYASNSTVWGYDLMNEPNSLGSVNWQTVVQSVITAIRAVDQTHTIIVEGNNWSHGNTWTTYNNSYYSLSDPNNNLVFEAHQYFDSDGSGNYNSNTVSGNGANANTGVTLITPFVNWCKTHNVKGMVGEYGVPNTADQTNWNTMLSNFLAYLQTNCIMGTYWAGGPQWGSYALSCEPTNNFSTDASQMSSLKSYTTWGTGCSNPCTPPSATITSSTTSYCPSSSVTLSANTGTGLTYQWNLGGSAISAATNSTYSASAAGTYTVTVKNSSNCSATSSATIITAASKPSATISAGGTTTFCTGGSVKLNANTGTGLTYQWNLGGSAISAAMNSSYSASAAGSYTVTVKNSSGCSATSSSTPVTVNAMPTTANAGTTQYITTTSTTLAGNTPTTGTGKWTVLSGTGTFTNSTSPTSTVNGLSTGANQLQWSITNGSCPASNSTVTINVGSAPQVQTISGPTSVTSSEQGVTYSVPYTSGNTYQWMLPAGATIASSNANDNQITINFGTSGGTVSVKETNSYGVTTSSVTVTMSVTAVIGSSAADSYQVYPNPFSSSVTIRVNNASGQVPLAITITDLQGIVCYSSSANYTDENIVTGEQLSAGVYIVQLIYGNQSAVVKLVKMQ